VNVLVRVGVLVGVLVGVMVGVRVDVAVGVVVGVGVGGANKPPKEQAVIRNVPRRMIFSWSTFYPKKFFPVPAWADRIHAPGFVTLRRPWIFPRGISPDSHFARFYPSSFSEASRARPH
jgi:hypothetical protein